MKARDTHTEHFRGFATKTYGSHRCAIISLQVTGWMDDTYNRQTSLLRRYNFLCRCPRCEDTAELGAYVGSPCCPECASTSVPTASK